MTYELSQRFYFEAAHTLRRKIDAEGSLRIHGHTYHAEVTISGKPDPESGMMMDLAFLHEHLREPSTFSTSPHFLVPNYRALGKLNHLYI